MNELALFGFEIALVIGTSFLILLYIGKRLNNILTEICGTAERADFWTGFIRLTFLFLPLLIVLMFGSPTSPEVGAAETARKLLSRLMLGELMTLSVIGFVLWRTIAAMNRAPQEGGQK